MKLAVSTVLLTLAWFAAINAAASLVAWMAAKRLCRRAEQTEPGPRPQLLFAIRMFPVVAASCGAFALYLPAHLVYESHEGSESFGVLLWALALVSGLSVGATLVRAGRAYLAARWLRCRWTAHGTSETTPIVLDAGMRGVSLAGILRTTIVVGTTARDVLTIDELELAVAHELGHKDAWDNLKRFAMFASPDFFGLTATARRLEQIWNTEVECQADAHAVRGDATRATTLASALLKVARLAGAGTPTPLVWSTLHEHSALERRVRLLVTGRAAAGVPSMSAPLFGLSVAIVMTAVALYSQIPLAMHEASELLVRLLP